MACSESVAAAAQASGSEEANIKPGRNVESKPTRVRDGRTCRNVAMVPSIAALACRSVPVVSLLAAMARNESAAALAGEEVSVVPSIAAMACSESVAVLTDKNVPVVPSFAAMIKGREEAAADEALNKRWQRAACEGSLAVLSVPSRETPLTK